MLNAGNAIRWGAAFGVGRRFVSDYVKRGIALSDNPTITRRPTVFLCRFLTVLGVMTVIIGIDLSIVSKDLLDAD